MISEYGFMDYMLFLNMASWIRCYTIIWPLELDDIYHIMASWINVLS